jgi:hypothetical protein
MFRCGGGTQLAVTRSTTGTADTQTQASWYVQDLPKEVAELRSRGVKIEEYDMPGLKTQDGIADIGFAWAAWIVDLARTPWASSKSRSRNRPPTEIPCTVCNNMCLPTPRQHGSRMRRDTVAREEHLNARRSARRGLRSQRGAGVKASICVWTLLLLDGVMDRLSDNLTVFDKV